MKCFGLWPPVGIVTFLLGIAAVYGGLSQPPENGLLNCTIKVTEPASPALSETDDTRAVYSTILTQRFDGKIFLVDEYTNAGRLLSDSVINNDGGEGLEDETVRDFNVKGLEPRPLAPVLSDIPRIILFTEKEAKIIFKKDQDGWKRFDQKYPQAKGLISLSAVGFNRNHTQAIVSVGMDCGRLCGEGGIFVLHKKAGRWTITKQLGAWVS
jgi:hypothetical protein